MVLTITQAEDCQSFRIYDPEDLTDYFNAGTPGTWSIVLTVQCNCEELIEVNLNGSNINPSVEGGVHLIITPEILGLTSIEDAVYSFTLRITRSDQDFAVQTRCIASLCETRCKVIQYIADNKEDVKAYSYFRALELIQECDNCTCEAGCTIFEELDKILQYVNEDSPCNCE